MPVGKLDCQLLTKEIDSYKPYGETPIGNALKGAAKDLGTTGKRTTEACRTPASVAPTFERVQMSFLNYPHPRSPYFSREF